MKLHPHDPFSGSRVRIDTVPDEPCDGPLHVHAHVDRYPPFVNAGAEWMLHAMLRHLVEAGHHVTVATNVDRRAIVDGVDVWPVDVASDLAKDCDVMVGHLLWTDQLVRFAHHHRRPLLYLVHNDAQVRYWRLDPDTVSALVFNSEWVAAAQRWPGPSIICRPPTMLRDYQIATAPPDDGSITIVNPNPEKGIALFYELARSMPERRFLVVGGAYGLQHQPPRDLPHVEFQPATGNMRRDVYARTRILLVPSKYESWGRVATEAICAGIPVIAHPTPGLREALDHAGIFADRDRPHQWVDAITMLDDGDVYRARSADARARAAELDGISRADLVEWERLVRRAGALVARPTVDA